MSAALIFLAALSVMAFCFAAASLLADYLAAHRRTDLPLSLGHTRVGLDHINAPTPRERLGARRTRR